MKLQEKIDILSDAVENNNKSLARIKSIFDAVDAAKHLDNAIHDLTLARRSWVNEDFDRLIQSIIPLVYNAQRTLDQQAKENND